MRAQPTGTFNSQTGFTPIPQQPQHTLVYDRMDWEPVWKGLFILALVLLAMSGVWWIGTSVRDHAVYDDCIHNTLCKTRATADIARTYNVDINTTGGVSLRNSPVITATHEAPLIINQPAPQPIIVDLPPAPAPRIVNGCNTCGGGVAAAPASGNPCRPGYDLVPGPGVRGVVCRPRARAVSY